jgi:hypothetical protein
LKLPNSARDMDLHPDGMRIATAHHDGKVQGILIGAKRESRYKLGFARKGERPSSTSIAAGTGRYDFLLEQSRDHLLELSAAFNGIKLSLRVDDEYRRNRVDSP